MLIGSDFSRTEECDQSQRRSTETYTRSFVNKTRRKFMRILVISDSHGRNDDIEGVLKQVGDIDMMIHCGDVERGDSYIREIADCPVVMVAGLLLRSAKRRRSENWRL